MVRERHLAACRTLEYALTLDQSEAWLATSTVWFARLSEKERAAVVFAFMRTLPADTAGAIIDHLFYVDEGPSDSYPVPALAEVWEEAQLWASCCDVKALKAYSAAGFKQLPTDLQHRFLRWAEGEVRVAS